jgi:CSLREA domain-containing protein
MDLRRRVALTLLAALFALALPATASAVVYEVNSTADEPALSSAACLTAGGKCSLRAAIEVANSTAGVADEVKFTANPFNGEIGDTISAASGFQTITDQLTIHGGICDTSAGVKGPCAGVIRAGGGSLFVVEDDDVEIQGLAINGATTAINVINASEGFVAKGDWIGFDLTGASSGNGTGIFIDPNSDGATIGGTAEADRNVIGGNAGVGLDLEGASDATIQGNYFGVTPKGDAVAANPKDIEITDSTSSGGIPAENNEVGNTIEGVALTSKACDGGCNVISGATSTGIDLDGEEGPEAPAGGPTTVHGNYVGLDATGTGTIANGSFGILAGAADDATIGGPEYEANANFIAGGSIGIYHENGENFVARSNQLGIGPVTADTTTAPAQVGIFVFGSSTVEPATIEGNGIRGGGIAIEQRFGGAAIVGNVIGLSFTGIHTTGSGTSGNLIQENMIGSVTANGILIQSDANEVLGNLVLSSGGAGISIQDTGAPFVSPTTDNLVGGDLPSEENEISNSGGPAIEIVDFEATANEVGLNSGKLNSGLFIDLKATNPGTEPNGPNEGIQPPSFAALAAAATGSGAEEGALIRVFRKGSSETGEIESFLGETFADVNGNWELEYPGPLPEGTFLAATQTSKGGTSELAFATTPGGNSGGGGGNGGGNDNGGGNNNGNPTPDTTAPKVTITKAPKAKSTSTTAKFKFKSNEAGSKFQCKLDKGKFKTCRSPKTYKKLKPRKHVFKVRATDKAGNVSKVAKRKFTVLG